LKQDKNAMKKSENKNKKYKHEQLNLKKKKDKSDNKILNEEKKTYSEGDDCLTTEAGVS